MNEDEIYRLGSVARRMGVDRSTVKRWCEQGKIECHRTLGGHYRVRKSVVDAMMNQQASKRKQEQEEKLLAIS